MTKIKAKTPKNKNRDIDPPLTAKKIATALKSPGRYRDERGLHLDVKSKTNANWVLRYERSGRVRWMGLGSVADVPLDMAREDARKARLLLRDGVDPIDQRASLRAAQRAAEAQEIAKLITFETAAKQYFDFHQAKWKNDKHRAQFPATMRDYVYPVIGKLPVGVIDRSHILAVLDPIWAVVPETANRVRGRIEAVLNFAKVRGYREGENPARWQGHLDQVLLRRSQLGEKGKVVHHPAMPFDQVPGFLATLRQKEGMSARALELCILTAARTGEVIGATWDEFDLEEGIWTVPASRMKAGREHRVALSLPAIALLKKLRHGVSNEAVFIGPRNGAISNMALLMLLKRMGFGQYTTHGFRSSFRDWVSERTNFAPEVAEAALAHVTGDKVERSYKRGDVLVKRRALMQSWANYCAKPVTGGTVQAIGRAA